VGNGFVSNIAAQIDIILIGKLLGTEMLGFYSVAKELILRPAQVINPIVTKVAFPTMAAVNNDINHVNLIFLKIKNAIASINFPVYIVTFILAPEIITLFLGKKWLHVTVLFQILSIWAMLRSIESPIGSLVMAIGKPEYEMNWNIVMMIYMPLVVYTSSIWGIEGIAYGNLISEMVLFMPGWYFLAYRLSMITLKEYFLSILSPLLISLFSGIFIFFLLNILKINFPYNILFTIFLGFILIWILNKKYNKDFYNLLLSFIGKK
jgi:O-antigen/teichoic acid export membrane protein